MQLRARHILTSLAIAGLGGAITLLARRKRPAARPDTSAVPDEIDGVPTGPLPLSAIEVTLLESELFDDDEIIDLMVMDDPVDPGFEMPVELDAQPSDEISEGITGARQTPAVNPDELDDRSNGEHWFEGMVRDASEQTPADRPLTMRYAPVKQNRR